MHIDTANQNLVVSAQTVLAEIQTALLDRSYTLPLGKPINTAKAIGEIIEWNEPHTLRAQHGSWRDWVLGLNLRLADGTKVKTGSMAIKSVAGYDLQRLVIGSRGSLATIEEVILRITPISAVRQDESEELGDLSTIRGYRKLLPTSFEVTPETVLADRPSSTVWVTHEVVNDVKTHVREAMLRAKRLFDPEGKLNPGVWGFM